MKNKNKKNNENSDFEQNVNPDVLNSMEMLHERAKLSKEKVMEQDEMIKKIDDNS